MYVFYNKTKNDVKDYTSFIPRLLKKERVWWHTIDQCKKPFTMTAKYTMITQKQLESTK